MIAPALGHGLSFNDLYDRDGLARLDAAFAGWLQTANVDVHARLMAARVAPDRLAAKDESNLLIEVARPLEDFLGALFGVTREATELRTRHNALAPLYDCKRLFVQRYVARTIKPDAVMALDGAKVTAEANVPARLEDGLEAWELAFALAVRATLGRRLQGRDADACARGADALRRLGAPSSRGQEAPSRRAAVQGAAQARLRASRADRNRSGGWRHAPEAAAADAAPSRRLCADRRRLRPGARARSHQLLHLVPQPGQGFVLARPARPQDRRVPEIAVRRHPGGLPARREDLGDESAQERGLLDRRAGDGGRRQSAGGRDRPSHLQRLHEGLHLPEAGAGRHPADRDPHPEGRARPAVGLRDLFAADALESAQPSPADPAAGDRPHRAGGRAGPGRLQPRPSPDE